MQYCEHQFTVSDRFGANETTWKFAIEQIDTPFTNGKGLFEVHFQCGFPGPHYRAKKVRANDIMIAAMYALKQIMEGTLEEIR
jgi:hypothetical protein